MSTGANGGGVGVGYDVVSITVCAELAAGCTCATGQACTVRVRVLSRVPNSASVTEQAYSIALEASNEALALAGGRGKLVLMAQRSGSHSVQAEERFEARSPERFNRIAYAIELLKVLKPPLTVAVYGTSRHMHLEQGRALGREAPWALFGVPPHATRANIARALAALSGLEKQPFLVDLLCATPAAPAG